MTIYGDTEYAVLQDHREGVRTNLRLRMSAMRLTDGIEDVHSGFGVGTSMGLGTAGDIHPFMHWAAPDRGEEFGVGSWANVVASVVRRGGGGQTTPGTAVNTSGQGGSVKAKQGPVKKYEAPGGGIGGSAGGGGAAVEEPGNIKVWDGTATGWKSGLPTPYTKHPPGWPYGPALTQYNSVLKTYYENHIFGPADSFSKFFGGGGQYAKYYPTTNPVGYGKKGGSTGSWGFGKYKNVPIWGNRSGFSSFGGGSMDAQRRRLLAKSKDKQKGAEGADQVGAWFGGPDDFRDGPARVGAIPIKTTSWQVDDRYVNRTFDLMRGVGEWPGGTLALALAGTKEERQEDLLYHADPRLVAANYNPYGDMGTRVYDLINGSYASKRWAPLQAMMRVVMTPGRPGLAWQLTTSEQDGLAGQGLVYGLTPSASVVTSTAHPAATAVTPGTVPIASSGWSPSWSFSDVGIALTQVGTALARASAAASTVINSQGKLAQMKSPVGGAALQAAMGVDFVKGEKGQAGGTPAVALMAHEAGGPLCTGGAADKHKIGSDEDGNPINPGHIHTDALMYMDSMRDGPWAFTRIPYPSCKDWPIPTNCYISWRPETEKWHVWTTVPEMESPPVIVHNPAPDPDPTTPPAPPAPPGPVTPGDGPIVDPGGKGRPVGARPSGVVSAYRRKKRRVSTAPPPNGSMPPNAHIARLRMQSFASILARPQNVTDSAKDFRHVNRDHYEWLEEDLTRPAVLREEAWGHQDNGTWDYSEDPAASPYGGGVTGGGLCFFHPGVGMEHAAGDDLEPAGVTATNVYRASGGPNAFWAAGVPDVTTGDMKDDSWRWFCDSDGKLAFQLKTAGTWGDVLELDDADSKPDTPNGYKVAGTTVVAPVVTGWTQATGTAKRNGFDTGAITLEELAQVVKALTDDIHSGGSGHSLLTT